MSNTSMTDFIDAVAKVMLADRPDIFRDHDDAVRDIVEAFSELSGIDPDDDEEYSVHFSGYVLTRIIMSSGLFEYTFSKKMVSLAIDPDQGESYAHDWTRDSKLLEIELNLPELEDDLDIEPNIEDDLNYNDDND